jgi:hypothetical protein
MSTQQFKQSLAVGREAEDNLSGRLVDAGFHVIMPESGYFPGHDISCTYYSNDWDDGDHSPWGFTTEVKYDVMASKTGNVAIEIRNTKQNKPSGIAGTRADLWCHTLEDEVWLGNVNEIRLYIAQNKPERTIKNAGDGNATVLLYKKDDIRKVFVRIDKLNPLELREAIQDLL